MLVVDGPIRHGICNLPFYDSDQDLYNQGGAGMNLDESQHTGRFRAMFAFTSQVLMVFLGVLFWSLMCILAASPAWLPSLVERAAR